MGDVVLLIEALRRHGRFGHEVAAFEVVETHISYVILTGKYAYKIKKPVAFPFLDFRTLEARKHFLDEELRLNRRTAPQLYLSVQPITWSGESPVLGGGGPVVEYALRMVQFDQRQRFDNIASDGALTEVHIDDLARRVACLHGSIQVATPDDEFGSYAVFRAETRENFATLHEVLSDDAREICERIASYLAEVLPELESIFTRRKREGFVRECHGDLHLSNIVNINGEATLFDCIEFNEEFRWIDVTNEIAFLIMDLDFRELTALGWRFLNAYLELTGDYEGLSLLRVFLIYRAMVRAKVSALRSSQTDLDDEQRDASRTRALAHLVQASEYVREARPARLYLTHGLSGSGKSWICERLAPRIGALRIRSDVERQRIGGRDRYDVETTNATYERLHHLAGSVLSAGYDVIVDATFLRHSHRLRFKEMASRLGVGFTIVWIHAPQTLTEERLRRRESDPLEPSQATVEVYHSQLRHVEPLDSRERSCTVEIDTAFDVDIDALVRRLSASDEHNASQ